MSSTSSIMSSMSIPLLMMMLLMVTTGCSGASSDRNVETEAAPTEVDSFATLGYSLSLSEHYWDQLNDETVFLYDVQRTTSTEDLATIAIGTICNTELQLADSMSLWTLAVEHWTSILGFEYGRGLDSSRASTTLELRLNGKVAAGPVQAALVGGGSFAQGEVTGPNCGSAQGNGFLEVSNPPEDGMYECADGIPGVDGLTRVFEDDELCDADVSYARQNRFVAPSGLVTVVTTVDRIRDRDAPTTAIFPVEERRVTVECGAGSIPPMGDPRDTLVDDCTANIDDISVDTCEDTVQGSCPPEYTLTRTVTIVDECGNSECVTQTFVVVDSTAPAIDDVPASGTVECDGTGTEVPASAADAVTITDACADAAANCEVSSSYNEANIDGACGLTYQVQRYWTAEDCCGNEAPRARQVVTVVDTTPPSLDVAGNPDVTIECGPGVDPANSAPGVTSGDACTPAGDVMVAGPTLVDTATEGCNVISTYEYNATDACWNVNSVNVTVTTEDTTPPEITLAIPTTIALECGAETVPAFDPNADASCSDSCQGAGLPVSASDADGLPPACTGLGDVTRTLSCADGCGNDAAEPTIVYSFVDTTPPSLDDPPAAVELDCADPTQIPAQGDLGASDTCSTQAELDVTKDEQPVPGFETTCDTRTNRTWTATDCAGNSVTVSQSTRRFDGTAPSLMVTGFGNSGDQTLQCVSDLPRPSKACTMDDCHDVEVGVWQNVSTVAGVPDECGDRYVVRREYYAKDACGLQTDSIVQTITFDDSTAPTFTSPVGPSEAVFPGPDQNPTATATDNCGHDVTIAANHEHDDTSTGSGPWTLRFRFTATDTCGNTATQEWDTVVTSPGAGDF